MIAIFKDPRQLMEYDCCMGDDIENYSFISTEIKKRLQTREKEIKLIESILNDVEASNIEQIIAKAQRNISKSDNVEIYSNVNISLEEIYNKVEEAKSALNNILHSFDLSEHSLPEIEDRTNNKVNG